MEEENASIGSSVSFEEGKKFQEECSSRIEHLLELEREVEP